MRKTLLKITLFVYFTISLNQYFLDVIPTKHVPDNINEIISFFDFMKFLNIFLYFLQNFKLIHLVLISNFLQYSKLNRYMYQKYPQAVLLMFRFSSFTTIQPTQYLTIAVYCQYKNWNQSSNLNPIKISEKTLYDCTYHIVGNR